ncbi:hypothetical protein EVJ58_g6511 [Rhodofomes roseus]|uniref:GED domain-containing protein n=1 Tax=Rhodofomes roseus TaxID=34475 RepID=A0A4Y9Y6Y5_9APHY|nr:hypothetical protein EVJ58_g6511 [Rhodofomes roseus]
MECRLLSSAGPWSCQISIRWEFHADGKRRNKVEEVPFGDILTDKGEVEMMLRRAQAAVLDTERPLSQFIVMDADELDSLSPRNSETALPFSQNIVCVDISGPNLTDLSFVDLPGIIQNAESNVVQFVERMVRSYISGTCLIVVALPMSDDIENQRALRLAREADRDGSRTIGVMTKPDTLGAGSVKAKDLWLDILEGRAQVHRLRHGYYCTRQPDDAERSAGITAAEAREAEARFFSGTAPWDTSVEKQRFGTDNLVNYLSNMLTEIINGVIPRLQREVDHKLSACYAELKTMPQQITGEPASYVLSLLSLFCVDVQSHVIGGPRTEALVQHNRREYEDFKCAIRSTAPRFIPLPSAKDAPPVSDTNANPAVDDEDEESVKDAADRGTRAPSMNLSEMRLHIQRSMTRELPFNVPYPAKTALIRSFQTKWEQACLDCFENVQGHFKHTLAQLIHSRFGRFANLENKVDAVVMELLRVRRAAALEQISTLLKFETTPFTQNTHYLSDVTAKTLARYKDIREGKVQDSARHTPSTEKPRAAGTEAYHEETERPALSLDDLVSTATQHSPSKFGSHAEKLGFLGGPFPGFTGFNSKPSPGPSANGMGFSDFLPQRLQAEALSALAKLGYTGLTVDDLGKLNPPDEYEEELKVMAEVRAYFQVSYKRIIDYIPLAIDHTFLYAFAEALQLHLIENLALGAPDAAARCTAYLSEDLDIVMRRQELTGRKASLEKAKLELMSVSFAGVELSASS